MTNAAATSQTSSEAAKALATPTESDVADQLQLQNQALSQELALTKQALAQSYDQLQSIYYWAETTESLNRAATVEDIFSAASLGFQNVFSATYANAALRDQSGHLQLSPHFSEAYRQTFADYNPWQGEPVNYSPIVVPSVAALRKQDVPSYVWAQRDALIAEGIKALIWLPIVQSEPMVQPVRQPDESPDEPPDELADRRVKPQPEQLLGYLGIYYEQPVTFDDALLYLAQNMANAIVFAIERKQAEVQLQSTLQQLKQTQLQLVHNEKMSSLGQLVAGVAHEINNPVSFIYGNIKHVDEYTDGLLALVGLYGEAVPAPNDAIQSLIDEIDLDFVVSDLPKTLDSMTMGANRIQEIVRSLRTFSRLDESNLKTVDLHEGIDSTLMILRHRLKATSDRPDIQVVKAYGDIPAVSCYSGPLNQVFMNILANAIDALEEDMLAAEPAKAPVKGPATISISTAVVNDTWVDIAIADNGPGIPEAVQQKIFDPFFTTKPIGQGTGMGMSISYKIITETHRGQLTCVSMPHEGTEFTIRIPVTLAVQ